MRSLWRLLQLLVGLASGFVLGYAAVAWLIEQDRRLRAAPSAGEGAADGERSAPRPGPGAFVGASDGGEGLWDKTLARFRLALDEGRRAAASARAELEAELAGGGGPSPSRSGPAL